MNSKNVLPPLFLDRLQRIFPADLHPEVLAGFDNPKPPVARAQKPDLFLPEILKTLSGSGISIEPLYDLPFPAFSLKKEDLRLLQEQPFYREGALYIQGLSSMLVPLALDPQPGERVLDLTAAPGSKTTLIALLMKNQGEIVANDNNRPRFFKMKAIVERQGFSNIRMTLLAGEAYGRLEPECFDRVLVDAPCSGEARFLSHDAASLGYWKMMKVRDLAKRQKRLLLSGFSALRPGGVLVYSTCTFAPEENEGVVAACLKKLQGCAELESFSIPKVRTLDGLLKWEKDEFPDAMIRCKRIVPDASTEGFFIAKIRKTAAWRWS